MLKKAYVRNIIIFLLCVSLCGCAGLQRKFARKKKDEERPAPVITTYDYAKDRRVDELYKKHFLFWKSWQTELINRMGATYKKRAECFDFTVSSLEEIKKYLKGPKSTELEKFITKIKTIDPEIRELRLSRSQQYRMKHLLETTKRQIDRQFSYTKVKDDLELME
ncbi:MAG: hypothetical protein KKC66_00575 [Candidatus Omnitrophica bacterium]|nr:hypothetical protein [Candidatus Omnitrophota bacterium]MBU1932388.1 hypothetical protein [Candidatus Omnitrophota bacterium]